MCESFMWGTEQKSGDIISTEGRCEGSGTERPDTEGSQRAINRYNIHSEVDCFSVL